MPELKGRFYLPPIKNRFLTKIVVKCAGVPSAEAILQLTGLKEGKDYGIAIVKDDAGLQDRTDWYPLIMGGIPDSEEIVWPGLRYSDGCGNLRVWHATQAINPNPLHDEDSGALEVAKWSDMAVMYGSGCIYPANHGFDHGGGTFGYDVYQQIIQSRQVIWDKYGLPMSVIVIPTAYRGYVITGSRNYSPLITSQGFPGDCDDGFTGEIQGFELIRPNDFNLNRSLCTRIFTGNTFSISEMDNLKNRFDSLVAGPVNKILHLFSHGMGGDPEGTGVGSNYNYNAAMHYMMDHEDFDKVGAWNLQEIWDYENIKRSVFVSKPVIKDNTITFNVSHSGINKHIYNLDTHFLIKDLGTTIVENGIKITSNLPSFTNTVNTSTGLVNLYGKNIMIANPYDDEIPPEITDTVADGSNVIISYSRPVTQSNSEENLSAYQVVGPGDVDNPVVSITEDGGDWILECENPIEEGSLFVYKSQDGDVVDADNDQLYVPFYDGKPIT